MQECKCWMLTIEKLRCLLGGETPQQSLIALFSIIIIIIIVITHSLCFPPHQTCGEQHRAAHRVVQWWVERLDRT